MHAYVSGFDKAGLLAYRYTTAPRRYAFLLLRHAGLVVPSFKGALSLPSLEWRGLASMRASQEEMAGGPSALSPSARPCTHHHAHTAAALRTARPVCSLSPTPDTSAQQRTHTSPCTTHTNVPARARWRARHAPCACATPVAIGCSASPPPRPRAAVRHPPPPAQQSCRPAGPYQEPESRRDANTDARNKSQGRGQGMCMRVGNRAHDSQDTGRPARRPARGGRQAVPFSGPFSPSPSSCARHR